LLARACLPHVPRVHDLLRACPMVGGMVRPQQAVRDIESAKRLASDRDTMRQLEQECVPFSAPPPPKMRAVSYPLCASCSFCSCVDVCVCRVCAVCVSFVPSVWAACGPPTRRLSRPSARTTTRFWGSPAAPARAKSRRRTTRPPNSTTLVRVCASTRAFPLASPMRGGVPARAVALETRTWGCLAARPLPFLPCVPRCMPRATTVVTAACRPAHHLRGPRAEEGGDDV
jgi:hypothetical protein